MSGLYGDTGTDTSTGINTDTDMNTATGTDMNIVESVDDDTNSDTMVITENKTDDGDALNGKIDDNLTRYKPKDANKHKKFQLLFCCCVM